MLDGCLLWGSRVIVPPPGQAQVMEELHDAHPGVSRMKSLARLFGWWPGMVVPWKGRNVDHVKVTKTCQREHCFTHGSGQAVHVKPDFLTRRYATHCENPNRHF